MTLTKDSEFLLDKSNRSTYMIAKSNVKVNKIQFFLVQVGQTRKQEFD